MSYKVYNYTLEFIDCPYNEKLKSKITELIKAIESTGGNISAKYDLEVSRRDDGSISSVKTHSGLNADQEKFLAEVEEFAKDAAKNGGGKSKIKNEVEVERDV